MPLRLISVGAPLPARVFALELDFMVSPFRLIAVPIAMRRSLCGRACPTVAGRSFRTRIRVDAEVLSLTHAILPYAQALAFSASVLPEGAT
jgi:hypothetical protein